MGNVTEFQDYIGDFKEIDMLPNDPSPDHRLPLTKFIAAQKLIDRVFLNSPQYNCEPLSDGLGCALTLKVETANPIRSFKGRGADYLVQSIPAEEFPIVSASAGNWGQALAYSCRKNQRELIIFASLNASPLKVERMRALGAEIRLEGKDFDASKIAAEAFAAANNLRMVADGLDPQASIGAGTIAMELLQHKASYDAVLVPCGNGAMLTGIGRWFKAVSPDTKIIGVQSRGADAMEKSWRSGKIVTHDSIATIADGIGVRVPIPAAIDDMEETVDEMILVDDATIIQGMKLAFDAAGYVLEPSGAAGIAAILSNIEMFRDQHIATVLCGGNATVQQIRAYLHGVESDPL
jgi:threonine dehydratase